MSDPAAVPTARTVEPGHGQTGEFQGRGGLPLARSSCASRVCAPAAVRASPQRWALPTACSKMQDQFDESFIVDSTTFATRLGMRATPVETAVERTLVTYRSPA